MNVTMDLTISYQHGEAYAAYLTLPHPMRAKVHRTRQFEGEILVDFGRDGMPLGIEMLDPRRTSLTRLNRVMKKLKLPPLTADIVKPLRHH